MTRAGAPRRTPDPPGMPPRSDVGTREGSRPSAETAARSHPAPEEARAARLLSAV
jgi:hypothetical protein